MIKSPTPSAFYWRRMHSLMGLWLVLFIIEHLLTNSQAALLLGGDGRGFIHAVNFLHGLPYLPVIEIVLLGVPILAHLIWGIKYALTSKSNSGSSDGSTPALSYAANKFYTWQRWTSWMLVGAIVVHVVHMRFVNYPSSAEQGEQEYFMVRVTLDEGLYTLAERLDVTLYDQDKIDEAANKLAQMIEAVPSGGPATASLESAEKVFLWTPETTTYDAHRAEVLLAEQRLQQQKAWVKALHSRPLRDGEVLAVGTDFGKAVLLMVRDTFKMPLMMVLYAVFVVGAAFHAFNGLWTFLITWGLILTKASQIMMKKVAVSLMALVAFMGLAAIFLTYWVNLRH